MGRLTAAALPLLLTGCLGYNIIRDKVGDPAAIQGAAGLAEGRSTLGETLARLGPPELLFTTGEVDRVFYVAWDGEFHKIVASFGLPIAGRNVSWDLLVMTFGAEKLHVARLDFDRAGRLVSRHVLVTTLDKVGQYAGLDDAIISGLIEDRERALDVAEAEEDE